MNPVLLDTDILSEIFKGVSETVLQNASDYLDSFPCLSFSSISVYEVLFGLGAKGAAKQSRLFLELIADHEEVVPDALDYRTAAQIRAGLHRAGHPIGTADPIIAACALNRSLPLVMGNTRHYDFIQNAGFPVVLLNWRIAPS